MEGKDLIDKYTAQAPTTEEAIEKALKALGLTEEEAIIDIVEESKKGFLGFGQKDAIVTVKRKESTNILDDVLSKNSLEKETESVEETPAPTASSESKDAVSSLEEPEEDLEDDEEEYEAYEETDVSEKEGSKTEEDEEAVEQVAAYLKEIGEQMGAAPVRVEIEHEASRVHFNLYSKKAGIIIGRHGKVLNALQSLAQVQLHKEANRKLTAIVDAEGYRKRRENTLHNLARRTAKKVSRTKQPAVLEPMPAYERKIIHHYLSSNEDVKTHSEGKEPHRYLVIEPVLEKKSILDQ